MQITSKFTAAFLIIVMVSSICLTGCGTTKRPPLPLSYSFAEKDEQTASITFVCSPGEFSDENVFFVDCNGKVLPYPDAGTLWKNTILFPAGEPLKLNVYVERDRHMLFDEPPDLGGMDLNVSGDGALGLVLLLPVIMAVVLVVYVVVLIPDVIADATDDRFKYITFECPPLEAGGQYMLRFDYRWIADDVLTLTKVTTKTKQEGFIFKKIVEVKTEEVVYRQKFQATLGEKDPDFISSTVVAPPAPKFSAAEIEQYNKAAEMVKQHDDTDTFF